MTQVAPLFDPTLVDGRTKAHVLTLLAQFDAAYLLHHTLDTVFLALVTNHYPLSDVLPYLYDGIVPVAWYATPPPVDQRRVCYAFWNRYITAFTQTPRPVRPRLPNGTQPRTHQQPEDLICHHLTQLPFLPAIHTWFAVVEEWLQICNIDWYAPYVVQYPSQFSMWQVGAEASIPLYLAGLKALDYW